LEEFESVQVVALDEQVLRGIEVDGLLTHGSQRLGDGCVGREGCSALPGPVKLIPLLRALDDVVGQLLAEEVEVHGAHRVPVGADRLGDHGGEEVRKLLDIGCRQVG
jgi:hypothetical protein